MARWLQWLAGLPDERTAVTVTPVGLSATPTPLPKRVTTASPGSAGFFSPVPIRALAAATGQLALMLKTGTSLVDALNALVLQREDDRLIGQAKFLR